MKNVQKEVLIRIIVCSVALMAASACSRTASTGQFSGQPQQQIIAPQPDLPSASNSREIAVLDFVNSSAIPLLSEADQAKAATAQYNALQFGRPGAPRVWNGSNSIVGKILVGPFIKQNNQDCRSFEHTVIINQVSHIQSGTACRTPDLKWAVSSLVG